MQMSVAHIAIKYGCINPDLLQVEKGEKVRMQRSKCPEFCFTIRPDQALYMMQEFQQGRSSQTNLTQSFFWFIVCSIQTICIQKMVVLCSMALNSLSSCRVCFEQALITCPINTGLNQVPWGEYCMSNHSSYFPSFTAHSLLFTVYLYILPQRKK